MGRLTGKVAIITGGGSGLGWATALHFGREGARLVVGDINPEGGQRTVEMICERGGDATFVRTDVTSASQQTQMIDTALGRYGRLDILFNNAGYPRYAPLAELDETTWDQVVDTSLLGVFLGCKYAIPAMLRTGGGSIINTASTAAQRGFVGSGAYSAAKGAIIGLTRAVALQYGKQGIRVNAICPGLVDTAFHSSAARKAMEVYWSTRSEEVFTRQAALLSADSVVDSEREARRRAWLERHHVPRVARPEDVADLVVFLASDESEQIQGAVVQVDGGVGVDRYRVAFENLLRQIDEG